MESLPSQYMRKAFRRGIVVFFIAAILSGLLFLQVYEFLRSSPVLSEIEEPREEKGTTVMVPDEEPEIEEAEIEELIIEEEEVVEEEPEVVEEPVINPFTGIDPDSVEVESITNDLVAYYILNETGNVILDLRGQKAYDKGHIRTSKLYDIEEYDDEDFERGVSYVFVCAKGICDDAKLLAAKIQGIAKDVEVLEEGFEFWDEEGFRVVTDDE